MPEVYYYVNSQAVSNIIDCGLKLSTFYDKEAEIDGEKKLCFCGLLNPKDDMELYRSEQYTCLKIQVKGTQCFVADRFLYDNAQKAGRGMEFYYKSIIPVERYIFGQYRIPECLITTTILAGEAVLLDKRMDSPVIYTNSEELYRNNILQELREQNPEIDDCLLYYYFNRLAETKKLDKIDNNESGTTVFTDGNGRTYCVKSPDPAK